MLTPEPANAVTNRSIPSPTVFHPRGSVHNLVEREPVFELVTRDYPDSLNFDNPGPMVQTAKSGSRANPDTPSSGEYNFIYISNKPFASICKKEIFKLSYITTCLITNVGII